MSPATPAPSAEADAGRFRRPRMSATRELTPDELLEDIEREWPAAANYARKMLERERRLIQHRPAIEAALSRLRCPRHEKLEGYCDICTRVAFRIARAALSESVE